MRIYLIGLPGVGKTTIGKELALKLKYEFIDLDNYIEQQAMLFVDEIFHLYGEKYFRALESNCLLELSEKDNTVIACGGGIVKNPKNKELMNGVICYLTASLNEIEDRLAESSIVRPLLEVKKLQDLYLERKEAYEAFATITIENMDEDEAISKIVEKIGELDA